ncbi:MAG: hypothetical protein JJ959_14700 [Nisaea sp.]|jgi:hypothetical protein|uniref:hypothetical protein n=1 Tax=Nisaea sp. TaxID=2024842 RepID=UPI001B2649B5|nr:hypothetical protein [Nisaea sp.]MBO6561790.1 hypothetical protein [Nisaea sp.]
MADLTGKPRIHRMPLVGRRKHFGILDEADEVVGLDQAVADNCHRFRIFVRDPEPECVSRLEIRFRRVEHA